MDHRSTASLQLQSRQVLDSLSPPGASLQQAAARQSYQKPSGIETAFKPLSSLLALGQRMLHQAVRGTVDGAHAGIQPNSSHPMSDDATGFPI